ncbi:hypothetical protein EVAR_25190_1 [Eumeta japonica]|uniref:Uncharacterized protein n=1 Tax=Eumeta variegata TaxID=151549 RepID=A0A4C1WHE8_EUMVA|nr:hypothetical protein EVAR_25190_1 [Eumeta japonica]
MDMRSSNIWEQVIRLTHISPTILTGVHGLNHLATHESMSRNGTYYRRRSVACITVLTARELKKTAARAVPQGAHRRPRRRGGLMSTAAFYYVYVCMTPQLSEEEQSSHAEDQDSNVPLSQSRERYSKWHYKNSFGPPLIQEICEGLQDVLPTVRKPFDI